MTKFRKRNRVAIRGGGAPEWGEWWTGTVISSRKEGYLISPDIKDAPHKVVVILWKDSKEWEARKLPHKL